MVAILIWRVVRPASGRARRRTNTIARPPLLQVVLMLGVLLANRPAPAQNFVSLSTIGNGLVSDGVVQLVGFGSFEVRERKARTGRNPQTNEPIQIPASKSVGFRPGAKLKETVST